MTRLLLKNVCLFICLTTCFYASEPCVDIIKTTGKRTQKYPLKKHQKITICAPYRTGSTLIYNICRFLFENLDVLDHSEHDSSIKNRIVTKPKKLPDSLEDKSIFLVGTIRNPIDSCFSHYRVMTNMYKITELHQQTIEEAVETYISDMKKLFSLKEHNTNICVLKYESFVNDFDALFKQLEQAFDIQIYPQDQALMKIMFSKENMAKYTKQMNSFINYDPRTHIHGYHIDQGEIPSEQKKAIQKKIEEKLAPYRSLIKHWGYEI